MHSVTQCLNCTNFKSSSRKASFLGDSNFPQSVDSYVKGMKIELYQDLYERYSKLALSFSADRPIAIKGLETRLIKTFGTTGGYGVFELYLHRCLLWQRAEATLKRIPSFHGIHVPSWSWMAYEGGIRYIEVPYGKVSWRKDIISFFAGVTEKDESTEPISEDDEKAIGIKIKAPAWDFACLKKQEIFLDEPYRKLSTPLKYVIIGESDGSKAGDNQVCWGLIIVLLHCTSDFDIWERVGVGIFRREYISLDTPATIVHIQ
jgi:hypothetical protein